MTSVPVTQTVRRDRRLNVTVVEMVAAVSNTRPEDLPPLAEVVDSDAMEALFSRTDTGWLSFDYNGYHVRVGADRTVTVREN